MESKIFEQLVAQGPVVCVLIVAIWYLVKCDDRKEARHQETLKAFNTEREERIKILEAHVVECNRRHDEEKDRRVELLMHLANLPSTPPKLPPTGI